MTHGWKDSVLPGGSLPPDYRREGELIGREELLGSAGDHMFADSEFVGRAHVPHTTSSAESAIRRRHLAKLVSSGVDLEAPALELGSADGLVTQHLLDLGFKRIVSTDIVQGLTAKLDASLTDEQRERVMLVVDDMHRLPFDPECFGTVIAWGVLSVSGDVERAIEKAWEWVRPGGHLILAEPILESILAYALVRGDLGEFRRIREEGTRAAIWEERDSGDRYEVHPYRFYERRLEELTGATVTERGGVSMLPSLVLGGVVQDSPVADDELAALDELVSDESLDDLILWRQAFWLVRKG